MTQTQTSARATRHLVYVPGVHDRAPATARQPLMVVAADKTEIGPLAAIATAVAFQSGAQILMEGDPAEHLFRINSGVVKVYRALADGRCQITGFLLPGDFLGLAPEDTYVSGAIAVGPVTVSRFSRKKVEQLVAVSPLVARLLIRRACSELFAAQDQMLLLGRKTATERVASFLIQIGRRTAGDHIELPMTRTDIADYLGLTIETVSRTLTQLRQDGVIDVHRAKIQLLQRAELEVRAEAA
ncbi:MAG: helix-turn-helix domain-containing protein [Proteobacteria bacterium]|nr:helix-turn-helix domain-containing protein [Pseudomonadota bacterium]